MEMVLSGAAVLVALLSAGIAWLAYRRARNADARAERVERLERVRFEIVRDPNEPSVFALVNVGTDTAEMVEISAESVVGVAFHGFRLIPSLRPTERSQPFQLGEHGVAPRLREPLRITWHHPFPGEQHVSLPADPDERWSYVLHG